MSLLILKGLDYAQYWPNPLWREFGDLDCKVVDGDSRLLDTKCKELGYNVDDNDYKHTKIRYNGMMVENHHNFTSFLGSKKGHLLERELNNLFKVNNKQATDCGLLSPDPTFTAVFMLTHAQNHFFYEGITLRHILDWHFFLTKEGENVDWGRVGEVLKKTGIKPFAELLTAFCKKHFGLQPQIPQIDAENVDAKLLERFENDLFAEQMNPNDRRWHKMTARMLHRYHRMWRFRELNKMSVSAAIWRTIAFSSFLHRKPTLE